MVRYAAYGSNLYPPRLEARVASARLLGTTMIDGYSVRFNKRSKDGSAKCNLEPSEQTAHVAIYELSLPDLATLHAIEGVGYGYAVETLEMAAYGPCHLYRAEPAYRDETLAPFSWYKALVIAGCRALEFPADYVRTIERVQSTEDDDAARHDQHMALLGRQPTIRRVR